MKYRYIKYSFFAALIAGLFIRYKQLMETTEVSTGFFKLDNGHAGLFYSVVLFVIPIAFGVCAAFVRRCPLKTPTVTLPLGLLAFVSGVFVLIESVTYVTQVSLFAWEKFILGVTGPATAIFLVLYGLKGFKNYSLFRLLYAVPTIYYLSRLICEFISVSRTPLIFQNILNLSAIAFILIFMLEWGKIANGVAGRFSYKTILISGGIAALLCEITSIPGLAFLWLKEGSVAHQNPVSLVNLAFMGVFIAFYLYRHFKNSNLVKKRHILHAKSLSGMDGGTYYMGEALSSEEGAENNT